jgi:hypothetical protein
LISDWKGKKATKFMEDFVCRWRMDYLKILSQHYPEKIDENQGKLPQA